MKNDLPREASSSGLENLSLPLEVRVHGRGGQGGVTCAKLIASLYTQMGLHVQTFGDYGSERSGAPIQAFTRVDRQTISNRNKVYQPDHLIVLDEALMGPQVLSGTTPGALLLLNTRSALDAFGQATVAVRAADSRIVWQTPLARTLLNTYFANPETVAPEELLAWIAAARRARGEGREPASLLISEGNKRLLASFHDRTGDDEWLVVLREENDASAVESLIAAFRLTQREAEVLYWVVRGKTSKDIGDILGSSPRTVDKHLEHVFEKLGVETRTAAANLAMGRMRGN